VVALTRRLLLAILMPAVAHASFSAAPCSTIDCRFQVIGIHLGVVGGLPASGLIFVGLVAFEIAAVVGAYHAVWRHPPGYRGGSPWEAFLVTYAILAVLSVPYVRSAPRAAREGG